MISRRVVASFTAVAVCALTLTACVPAREQVFPPEDGRWPGASELGGSGLHPEESRVYSQTITWDSCGTLDCAQIQVPLDWTDPQGETITLALNRLSSTGGDPMGTVVINPGGPGASGLGLTEYFADIAGDDLRANYDVVGFDPRGVGESTPITCGSDKELNAYFLADHPLETAQDVVDARQRTVDFAERCREESGPLIAHIDTVSAARDMDVIRHLVGDTQLNYLGFSYGTQLGAAYANLYPQNVGRMVLDGAVDFLLPPEELAEGQAKGFENALTAYVTDCLQQSECPFVGNVDQAKRQMRDLVLEARDKGFPTDRGDVNGNLMVYGVVVTLYNDEYWDILSYAFDEVITEGTAVTFLYLANAYLEREDDGSYTTNSNEAFTAINCLDEGEPGEPWTIAEVRDYRKTAEADSPTFGWWFASSLGCEGWPWQADEVISDLTRANDAGPIVIIGTTGDPATPFKWAESLADQLRNSSLLVFEGEGHTAYGRSNQCITDAVDAYFVSGTVPVSGKRC